MRENKGKKGLAFLIILVLLVPVGWVGWNYFGRDFIASRTPQPPRAAKSAKAKPQAKTARETKEEPVVETRGRESGTRQVYSSPGTLGDLSRARAQRSLLEQQVRIVELEQKIRDTADRSKGPAQRQVVPDLSPRVAELEQRIAELTVRADEQDRKTQELKIPEEEKAKKKEPVRQRGPVVISVQGIEGALSATIRGSGGRTVTVRDGASFAGGKISVTRDRVAVNRRGKITAIPFE